MSQLSITSLVIPDQYEYGHNTMEDLNYKIANTRTQVRRHQRQIKSNPLNQVQDQRSLPPQIEIEETAYESETSETESPEDTKTISNEIEEITEFPIESFCTINCKAIPIFRVRNIPPQNPNPPKQQQFPTSQSFCQANTQSPHQTRQIISPKAQQTTYLSQNQYQYMQSNPQIPVRPPNQVNQSISLKPPNQTNPQISSVIAKANQPNLMNPSVPGVSTQAGLVNPNQNIRSPSVNFSNFSEPRQNLINKGRVEEGNAIYNKFSHSMSNSNFQQIRLSQSQYAHPRTQQYPSYESINNIAKIDVFLNKAKKLISTAQRVDFDNRFFSQQNNQRNSHIYPQQRPPPNMPQNYQGYSRFAQENSFQRSKSISGIHQPTNKIIPPLEYLNESIQHCKWSVMYETDDVPTIPLILDRNDRTIHFTDKLQTASRPLKSWQNMDFESKEFYSRLFISQNNRTDLNLQHSSPSINLELIEPNPPELLNWHHPRFDIKKEGTKFNINFAESGSQQSDGNSYGVSPYIKDLQGLSGKNGDIVIIEHTSEQMPFIMNVGMASKLIVYWHKKNPLDFPKAKMINERMCILEPDQTAPFIAQIPRSEPVPCLLCNMFSVPVAEHPPAPTDFLLVKAMTHPVFYLRPISTTYCAGFMEPHMTVMRPQTKLAQNFHLDFIKVILINIFRGTDQFSGRNRIQVNQIQKEFFPGVNEPKLRSVLKKFAKFVREQGNGFWERSKTISLDQQFSMTGVTPEKVCKYESMRVGLEKLRQSGVSILTRSKRIYQQLQVLKGDLTRKVASKIEIELMKTPWARTENFTKAFQGRALQIEHADDGQQIMRSKSRKGNNKFTKEVQIGPDGQPIKKGDEEQATNRRQLAGTDADLRALTLRELKDKLLDLGVSAEEIDRKTRWQQVSLLRELANRQAEIGGKSDIVQNYARGPRNDYTASLEAYKKQYQATFLNNLSFIRSSATPETSFDDGNILDDIGLQMMREGSEEEEEDNEEIDFDDDDDKKEKKKDSKHESKNSKHESKEGTETKDENDEQKEGENDEKSTAYTLNGDPAELKPNGVCVSPTHIDWDEIGFAGVPRRPVAKVITILPLQEGPNISLQWLRLPSQIADLKKKPAVFSGSTIGVAGSGDLEEHVLKNLRKTLLDKQRRIKNSQKHKGAKTQVQSYLPNKNRFDLVTDEGGELTFRLTPEIAKKIMDASDRFSAFERKTTKSHKKNKRESFSDESDSDDFNVEEEIPKSRNRRENPVVLFNNTLKTLLARVLQVPGNDFWVFREPVLKKDAPDYHLYVTNPMCFNDIERKADQLKYMTVQTFYADVRQIEINCNLYNKDRNEGLINLCKKMMDLFNKELQNLRDQLDELERKIDPVLRRANPNI